MQAWGAQEGDEKIIRESVSQLKFSVPSYVSRVSRIKTDCSVVVRPSLLELRLTVNEWGSMSVRLEEREDERRKSVSNFSSTSCRLVSHLGVLCALYQER